MESMKIWPDFGLEHAHQYLTVGWQCSSLSSLWRSSIPLEWLDGPLQLQSKFQDEGILDELPSVPLCVSPSNAVTARFLLNFFTSLFLSLSSATF